MGDQTYTFDVHRLGFETLPKASINLASLQKPLKKLYIAYQKALSTNLPLSKVRLNANRRGLSIDSILNTSEEQNTFMNEALITDNQVVFRGAVVFTILSPEKKNSKFKIAFTNLDEEIKMKNIKEHNSLFVSLDEKEKFLIEKDHPSLFICVNKTRTSKNFEMRVFVCYSSEQALDLMKALKGDAVHEYAKKPYNQIETASRENSLAGKSSTDSVSNNNSDISTPALQQNPENQGSDDLVLNTQNANKDCQQSQNTYQPQSQNLFQQPQPQNMYQQQKNAYQQEPQNSYQQQPQNAYQQQPTQNSYQQQHQPPQNAFQRQAQDTYQPPIHNQYEHTIPNYPPNVLHQGGEGFYSQPNYGFSVFQDPHYQQTSNEIKDVAIIRFPRINLSDMNTNDLAKVSPKAPTESNLYNVQNRTSVHESYSIPVKEEKDSEKMKLSKLETQMPYSSAKKDEKEEDDSEIVSNINKQSIYPFSPVVKDFVLSRQPLQNTESSTRLYPQLSEVNSPLLSPINSKKPTTPSPRNSQIDNQKILEIPAPQAEKVVQKKVPPAVPTKKPTMLPLPALSQKPQSQSSDEGIVSPSGIINGKESLHLIKPKKFKGISVLPFPVNLQKPEATKEAKEDLTQGV